MTEWPRHFEFYVASVPEHFYEVDLDAKLPTAHISIWLSPKHPSYRREGRKLFRSYSETGVLNFLADGTWVISEIYDASPFIIEDLI